MIKLDFKEQKFSRQITRSAKSEIVKRGQRIVVKYGFKALTISKRYCNVDTGALRASGNVKFTDARLRALIEYPLHYAGFVHDGTRYMKGSFYLSRAIGEIRSDYLNELERTINGS